MKPILFSIQNYEIRSLVIFLILGFIIFAFLLWKNLQGIIKKNTIFDIVIFTLVLSPLTGRLVYVVENFNSYIDKGWYFLPIRDTSEGTKVFDSAPWNFLAIWDKGIYIHFIPVALFIGVYLSLMISRQKALFRKVIQKVWASLIPAYLIILVGFLLDGSYIGKTSSIPIKIAYEGENEARLAVQIIEIIILLVIAIFYLDNRPKKLSRYSRIIVFPLIWFIGEALIWFEVEQYSKDLFIFDTVQLTWIAALFIYLIYVSSGLFKNKTSVNKSNNINKFGNDRVKYQRKFLTTGQISHPPKKYNISFSNSQKKILTDMSIGEKVKMTKNKLKRGL